MAENHERFPNVEKKAKTSHLLLVDSRFDDVIGLEIPRRLCSSRVDSLAERDPLWCRVFRFSGSHRFAKCTLELAYSIVGEWCNELKNIATLNDDGVSPFSTNSLLYFVITAFIQAAIYSETVLTFSMFHFSISCGTFPPKTVQFDRLSSRKELSNWILPFRSSFVPGGVSALKMK